MKTSMETYENLWKPACFNIFIAYLGYLLRAPNESSPGDAAHGGDLRALAAPGDGNATEVVEGNAWRRFTAKPMVGLVRNTGNPRDF